MKLKLLGALLASCAISHGAVILAGNVSGSTDNAGGDVPDGSTVVILVDLDGSGIPTTLDPFSATVGGLAGGDFIAAVGTNATDFFGSNITLQSGGIDLGVTTGVNTGQAYYTAWFPGQTGSDIGPGQFGAAQNAEFVVPGDGNTQTPTAAIPPFQFGTVVPEPSSALLLGLASLAFLRRRR